MSKLVKRCCIVLLVGTTLSATTGVQGAKADQYDNVINDCNRVYQSRGWLTPQEFQVCNLAVQYKQRKINRETQFNIWNRGIQTQNDILDMGANPIIPQPTDFGVGN
ncbi:hypothetical protein G7B40_032125 [Aetokthonos hydrillicola Thurmond2011]|jgi:hypothetical protein|uniref:Uncharacterized protein n=1 Tax=Aetokthonos hydrillicola Thurmond2011 TaxID=2712845 RepID=A0AAP5IGY1_9CYAN|nr:hypothetical protein [Aetokthonos hydrillicola]MBO3462442.1 hypothetical protein [Aetokthonos hydrillicola CCALA 1050]MBW4590935.1 hypothetical protein [Aetokthonos hydrillicola CCALA 1050]MDR9899175.1 hypothetical protein [Aetokthonos hydrillicola Thurmond2011]